MVPNRFTVWHVTGLLCARLKVLQHVMNQRLGLIRRLIMAAVYDTQPGGMNSQDQNASINVLSHDLVMSHCNK